MAAHVVELVLGEDLGRQVAEGTENEVGIADVDFVLGVQRIVVVRRGSGARLLVRRGGVSLFFCRFQLGNHGWSIAKGRVVEALSVLQVLEGELGAALRRLRFPRLGPGRGGFIPPANVLCAIGTVLLLESDVTRAVLEMVEVEAGLLHVQSRLDTLEYGTDHLGQRALGDLLVGGAPGEQEDIVHLAHSLQEAGAMNDNLVIEDGRKQGLDDLELDFHSRRLALETVADGIDSPFDQGRRRF